MAMSMGQDENASLSSELEELIRIHFDPQAQPAVRATLLSYAAARPGPVTDRVQFDLLHLSAGDADRLKRLTDLAAQDPRDVMSQEYFWVGQAGIPAYLGQATCREPQLGRAAEAE
jgi:hypothetical protein